MRTIVLLALACASSCHAGNILLDGGVGLQWLILEANGSQYALGQPLLNHTPVDSAVDDGIAFWRRESDFLVVPVLAGSLQQYDSASALLSGSATLPTGALTQVSVSLELSTAFPGASIRVSFSSNVSVSGWQLCVKWAHDGPGAAPWRASGYPFAGNTTGLQPTGLDYVGWPGFWLYRPDASVVAHFALDIADDCRWPDGRACAKCWTCASRACCYSPRPDLNPTSWTGKTQFTFVSSEANGGYEIAPQYFFGGAGLAPAQVYSAGMTLYFAQVGRGKGRGVLKGGALCSRCTARWACLFVLCAAPGWRHPRRSARHCPGTPRGVGVLGRAHAASALRQRQPCMLHQRPPGHAHVAHDTERERVPTSRHRQLHLPGDDSDERVL